MVELMPRYRFTHPGNVGIYGKTQSGKTTLIFELIRYSDLMVRDKYDMPVSYKSIWVFHGVSSQPLYETIEKDVKHVIFYKGFPTQAIEDVIREEQRPALVFINDQEHLLREGGENRVKNLMNRDSHHLDMLVIMSFQSLFPRGDESVNIQRQFDVHIFMTFSNNNSVKLKLEKIMGNKQLISLIMRVWQKWASKRGGYMLIDLHLDKKKPHEQVLAWNGIFPKDQDRIDPPRLLKKKFLFT